MMQMLLCFLLYTNVSLGMSEQIVSDNPNTNSRNYDFKSSVDFNRILIN